MPIYSSGGTVTSTYYVSAPSYLTWEPVPIYAQPTPASNNSSYERMLSYIATDDAHVRRYYNQSRCTCYQCNLYRRTIEMMDHFTEPYIPFHPTADFIPPEEREPMIPNPLPELQIHELVSRYSTATVVHRIEDLDPAATELRDLDLSGLNLDNVDFSRYRIIEDVNFAYSSLREANFSDVQLQNVDFSHANLYSVSFRRTKADSCDFTGSRADYIDLTNATLSRSNFNSARWRYVSAAWSSTLEDLTIDHRTEGFRECGNCGEIRIGDSNMAYVHDLDHYQCEDCGYSSCDYCGDNYADTYEHESECSSRRHGALHDYSFRPYSYRPKGNYPAEALMGVELEVGGNEFDLTSIVNNHDPAEEHLYCKEDGSVEGIEVVTHPMTLNWAKQFGFETLIDRLKAKGHTSDGYGLHVHVSRNAFRSTDANGRVATKTQPIHQMTWLTFLYRNSENINDLARRESHQWAKWSAQRKGELKQKARGPHNSDRYQAINCQNDRTFEIRVFRSTLDFSEFMAAIEFADATVRYTEQVTVTDVLHNQAMSWAEFYKWTGKQGTRYVNLRRQMARLTAV